MTENMLEIFRQELKAATDSIHSEMQALNAKIDGLIDQFGSVVVERIPDA
jgi:hypothetical protein